MVSVLNVACRHCGTTHLNDCPSLLAVFLKAFFFFWCDAKVAHTLRAQLGFLQWPFSSTQIGQWLYRLHFCSFPLLNLRMCLHFPHRRSLASFITSGRGTEKEANLLSIQYKYKE